MTPRRFQVRPIVLVCLALLAGCNRKPPQFVPRSSDSTATTAADDSFAVLVGATLDRWESGAGPEAATATARLLLSDLGRHPDLPLGARARTLLDSCGFSAEVSGSGPVVAVNLFSRSDPSGGAWPHLLWRDPRGVHEQALDGSGMRLVDVATRPDVTPAVRKEDQDEGSQVALLLTRTGSRGQQPVVIVWRRPAGGKSWALTQTLGPDSLGGVGSAQFVVRPDGEELEAKTYRVTSGFDECATCPHVFHTIRFAWTSGGFARRGEETTTSPYATFVQLIAALRVDDREMALRQLADPQLLDTAQRYEWGKAAAGTWRVAPGTEEATGDMVFFRGPREAYRVRFVPRGGQWLVSDLQPVQRSIE